MTYKESIIANIALRAGEYIYIGDIQLTEKQVINGLTEDIMKLSDQFFEKYPESFFKDGELDFSEEISVFTKNGFQAIAENAKQAPDKDSMMEEQLSEAVIYLLSGGGTKRLFHSGTYQECLQLCEALDWRFWDENEFEWSLDLEDLRENSIVSVCPVTIIRVRDWENEAWSDDFYVDVTKSITEDTFKAAIQEYLNTEDGRTEIENTNEDFNWGDAMMYVPEEIWNKHGIYSAPRDTSPSDLGLNMSSEHPHQTIRVNQDEILIPDSYFEQKEEKHQSSLDSRIKNAKQRSDAGKEKAPILYDKESTLISYENYRGGVNNLTCCRTNPVGVSPYIMTGESVFTSGEGDSDKVIARHNRKLDKLNKQYAKDHKEQER